MFHIHVLYYEAHITLCEKNVLNLYKCIELYLFLFEWNGLLNACVLNKFFIYVLYSWLVYLLI